MLKFVNVPTLGPGSLTGEKRRIMGRNGETGQKNYPSWGGGGEGRRGGVGSRGGKGGAAVPSSLQSPSIHLFLRAPEELVLDKNNPSLGIWKLLKCPQSCSQDKVNHF